MSETPLNLTRTQLAEFLPNPRTIRAFEQMLVQTNKLLPDEITAINSKLDIVAGSPPEQADSAPSIDYIDMNANPPHSSKPGRLAWNKFDDTLNIHHTGGITQQVGQETYTRITNVSGAPILNGRAVSVANVGMGGPIGGEYYIADGTVPSLYIVGIATQDIAETETGLVTNTGLVRDIDTTGTPYGEVWAVGDILYASPLVAGALTKVKPTAPSIVLPIALVLTVDAATGTISVRPSVFLQLYYGSFYSTAAQTAAAINTAYAVTFNTTLIAAGVSIGAPTSRIVCANAGYYEFTFSVQAVKSTAAVGYLRVWLRKNGVNVVATTARIALQGSTAEALLTRTLPLSMAAGDYAELMWAVDSTAISLFTDAATAYSPVAPSATMAVAQINQ